MSVINNATNPFLLNIQPINNQPQYSSGLDPVATLRSDVNDIQQMVIFSEKRIAVDVISSYSEPTIQVINNLNIASNNILSINDIPVVPGGTVINNYGCNSAGGSEYLGSNSYGWWFPPSTIGGVGIKDATGIPRSNADTYTDAITKIDYYLFENLVDSPPAPTFLAETQSISSINFYWSAPPQFKFNFLNIWSPYISSIQLNLYSNVSSSNSNLWFTSNLNTQYAPKGTIPLAGVEFMNSLTVGSNVAYSNATLSNYVLQIGLSPTQLTTSNGPYTLSICYQNYSVQPNRYLVYPPNNIGSLIPRAPTAGDFTIALFSNSSLNVNVIPTLNPDAYLTPTPVYYYTLIGAPTLCNNPGPYSAGSRLGVSVVAGQCGYGASFQFSVIASNAYGTSAAKLQAATTGAAPFAATPTVGLSGTFNSNTGAPTLTFNAGNQDGTLFWSFTTAPFTSGSNPVSSNTTLAPTSYFQYYNSVFTFRASNVAFCKQTTSASASYSSNFFVAAPVLAISVVSSNVDNSPPFYITVSASNLPFLGSGVSLSNTWVNFNGTNVSGIVTTASNLTCVGSNTTTFTFGSTYVLRDSAGLTRSSTQTTITGFAGSILHTISGTISPTQQLAFTFPLDAIGGTCTANASVGYQYTGSLAPGGTIVFQRINDSISFDGTYTYSYRNFTP